MQLGLPWGCWPTESLYRRWSGRPFIQGRGSDLQKGLKGPCLGNPGVLSAPFRQHMKTWEFFKAKDFN